MALAGQGMHEGNCVEHHLAEGPDMSLLDGLPRLRARAAAGDAAGALADLADALRQGTLRWSDYDAAGEAIRAMGAKASHAVRLAVVGSCTTRSVANAAACVLLRDGATPILYEGPFAAFRQEILDPASGLHGFAPDAVLLAVDASGLQHMPSAAMPAEAVEQALQREVDGFARLWEAVADCRVLQHVICEPEETYRGPAEARLDWSPLSFVRRLNQRLQEDAPPHVRWLDVDWLAGHVGRRNWRDPRMHYHARVAFDPRFLPDYAALFAGAWSLLQARARKVLVLDLDNTLWGGTVGDDGLEGIRLGPGTAEGEAYRDFCLYVRGLRERGVILAVCSRNDPAVARAVFERHPAMPLRLEHFAAFACSWDDKPRMLLGIAEALNLHPSSMVLVDDNPAECELVRQQLPEVATVCLPDDPALFRRHLDEQRLFDQWRLSDADIQRGISYAALRQAEESRGAATHLDAYLDSLRMVADCRAATDSDLLRLAQLEGKTNQFNLTTRRYGEAQLRAWMERPDGLVLRLSLADRFADHGVVALLVAVHEGDAVRIDDWLMSCRVFSRTVEHLMLSYVAAWARERGARRLVGEYRATDRNGVVADLYANFGFIPCEAGWEIELSEGTAWPSKVSAPRS